MKSITLLILLTICTTSYGLSCIITDNGEPLKIPFNDFNYDDFMNEVENLPINEDDDDVICRVELAFGYTQQRLIVKFSQHLQGSELEVEVVQFDTSVRRIDDTEDFAVFNLLEYACSHDGCEKEFIGDHINWLVAATYTEFKEKVGSILLGNGNRIGE